MPRWTIPAVVALVLSGCDEGATQPSPPPTPLDQRKAETTPGKQKEAAEEAIREVHKLQKARADKIGEASMGDAAARTPAGGIAP